MYIGFEKTKGFGDPNLAYVYDSRSLLYTSKPICLSNVNELKIELIFLLFLEYD